MKVSGEIHYNYIADPIRISEAVVTGVSFLGAGTIIRNQSENQLVFHTLAGDKFGHERPSDRARNVLLDYANFLTT